MGAGRRIAVAVATIGVLAAPVVTVAPASARTPPGRALTVTASAPVLTLPAKDGLRDATRIRIASASKGTVELLAVRGRKVLPLTEAVPLKRASKDWGRTITVSVKDLTAGPWVLRARRSDDHAARASTRIRVGTGKPVHVRTAPVASTVYPYRDGSLDAFDVTVTATDETAQPLPIRGTVRLESTGKPRTRALRAGHVRIPATGLPLGGGTLLTTATGPAGKPVHRHVPVTLAATGVGTARLARSADTVQPVRDGLLDAVTLTTSGAASAGSRAPVTGALVVSGPAGVVARWPVPDGTPRTFTWDGRVNGTIVPATYLATLTLKGPEGVAKVRTKTLLVTKDHLPYRVRDLFGVVAGNQQGLAVHAGTFYVTTDVGDGSSRIDRYAADGAPLPALATLPIGHGAELSYSTTTNLLYAANGGATTPTHVWAIDPTTGAIVSDTDLSALGPNGLVAVDDGSTPRLLVFSGTSGGYWLTPVPIDATTGVGAPGQSIPVSITGTPQGLEVVGTELWIYTSLKGANHLQRFSLINTALAGPTAFDLMFGGEGEGLATDGGSIYVGAHGPNRVGILEPVADE